MRTMSKMVRSLRKHQTWSFVMVVNKFLFKGRCVVKKCDYCVWLYELRESFRYVQ